MPVSNLNVLKSIKIQPVELENVKTFGFEGHFRNCFQIPYLRYASSTFYNRLIKLFLAVTNLGKLMIGTYLLLETSC